MREKLEILPINTSFMSSVLNHLSSFLYVNSVMYEVIMNAELPVFLHLFKTAISEMPKQKASLYFQIESKTYPIQALSKFTFKVPFLHI